MHVCMYVCVFTCMLACMHISVCMYVCHNEGSCDYTTKMQHVVTDVRTARVRMHVLIRIPVLCSILFYCMHTLPRPTPTPRHFGLLLSTLPWHGRPLAELPIQLYHHTPLYHTPTLCCSTLSGSIIICSSLLCSTLLDSTLF